MKKNKELQILEQILNESSIDKTLYSVGEYAEDSLCILYDGELYKVFKNEQGNKYNCHGHHSIEKASIDMIGRLTKDDKIIEELLKKVEKKLK